MRDADVPYVSHLFGVAGLAMEYGASEDEAIAALLHDAVEDQGGKPVLDEIRRRFAESMIVSTLVAASYVPRITKWNW